tara:strand:- start:22625 stop:23182 length:558 start_codon:yes stop_codon:yes gene_type:complete
MKEAMTEPKKPAAGAKSRKTAPQPPERVGGPRAIADLMPRIGGAAFRRFGFVQSSVVARWAEIVGERTAAISAPESIRFPTGKKAEGTLSLTVMSGHAPIVQHIVPEIITRVNRFFGYPAVAKVVIRQGEIVRREPERRPPPASLKPVPTELGDSLRDIGDPELRAVLESMAQGLANAPPLGKIS